jgi:hypothetical protein
MYHCTIWNESTNNGSKLVYYVTNHIIQGSGTGVVRTFCFRLLQFSHAWAVRMRFSGATLRRAMTALPQADECE